MNSSRLPTGPFGAIRLLPALAMAGFLLATATPLAAEELKSTIDRAGSAASQQIEQWLGAPAPKPARKTRARTSTTPKTGASAAGATAARAVPLPPPRPAEADAEAPAETADAPAPTGTAALPAAKPDTKSTAKPSARPAGPSFAGIRPAQPAGPVEEPAPEEPSFAEAPGIPLPPERPGRVAMATGPAATPPAAPPPTAPAARTPQGALVPLPPERPQPRMATLAAPPAGKPEQPPAEAEDYPTANVPLPPERPQAGPQARTAMLAPAPDASSPAPAPDADAPPAGSALTPPPGPLAGCPELSIGDIGTFTTAAVTMKPACRIERPVALTGVKLKDGRLVPIEPPATLRCDMAAAVARWVREGVAPAVETLGSPLATIEVADSYSCRPRNRVAGAKISEHGQGNAMDTRGYKLMDGRRVLVGGTGDEAMPLAFQEQLKATACADFMTILGPGSDGYHELHLHVDRAVRRNNMVLCRWATGTRPPGAKAASGTDKPESARSGGNTAASPKAGDTKAGDTKGATPAASPEEDPAEAETDEPESEAPANAQAGSSAPGRAGGSSRK
ncbi:extensin family protein [Ancylobacter sonchi]|uniref:extensin family protein n=1 Tax=Ancylobacter sonchi TaxID=1937790 RepID=UPI001BD32D31|nr:extensin family protein [Ancylobacter sonchi]MBS7534961.1 extensin family protein [Ancylobacter sonchi]